MTLNCAVPVVTVSLVTAVIGPSPAGIPSTVESQQTPNKASRTPAELKISSQLLTEIRNHERPAKDRTPPERTVVTVDADGRALVDVRAVVAAGLLKKIRSLGATIVSTSPEYRSIVAWMPLAKIKQLAADSAIVAIQPAPQGTTVK
jgi:hypothetical protein